jgi:hypothetical protein
MQLARIVCVIGCVSLSSGASAEDRALTQLDPFAQATRGDPRCPEHAPPLLTPEEARVEAHVRVERGLRCAMDGSCEAGGAYRRDAEINERVRAMIAGDRRFVDTSIWVTTTRKWVTLQGCVRSAAQQRALEKLVRNATSVERVFDELKVGRSHAHPAH